MEEVAIFVIGKTAGGHKSGIAGIDFEYNLGGKRYLFSMKSGLHWGNSGQWAKLEDNFKNALKVIKQPSLSQDE